MDLTEKGLADEIRAAEKNRDDHLYRYDDNIRSYQGVAYSKANKQGKSRKDNAGDAAHIADEITGGVYESIAVSLPRLAYSAPKVVVEGRSLAQQRRMEHGLTKVEEMTHAMNAWTQTFKLNRVLRQAAVDFQLAYACLMVRREPYESNYPSEWGQMYIPRLYRVSPKHVFWDPAAEDETLLRYIGHGYMEDIDSLIKQAEEEGGDGAGWNMDALRKLKANAQSEDLEVGHSDVSVTRNNVYVRQVWVPEHEPEGHPGTRKGYHGSIFWTAARNRTDDNSQIMQIREPQPYYGPDTGPYTTFGVYPSSGGAFPVSPATAVRAIHDKANHLAQRMWRQACNQKRPLVVNSGDADSAEIIRQLETDDIVTMDAGDKSVQHIVAALQLGGVDRGTSAAFEWISTLAERQRGVDSQQAGVVDPGGTATASLLAANSAQAIGGYTQGVFEEGVLEAIRAAAWFFYYDQEVTVAYGPDVSQAINQTLQDGGVELDEDQDAWYRADEDPPSFGTLRFGIVPDSMSSGGDVAKRGALVEAINIVRQAAMSQIEMGDVFDWEKLAQAALETLNLSGLATSIRFKQGAEELSPQQAQALMGGSGGQGAGGIPGVAGGAPTLSPDSLGQGPASPIGA